MDLIISYLGRILLLFGHEDQDFIAIAHGRGLYGEICSLYFHHNAYSEEVDTLNYYSPSPCLKRLRITK